MTELSDVGSIGIFLNLAAALIAGLSGVPSFFISRTTNRGTVIATLLIACSSLLALLAAGITLSSGTSSLPIHLPLDVGRLALDSLSAIFAIAIALVSLAASLFSLGYWPITKQRSALRLTLFLGILTGALYLLLLARDAVTFLTSWEIMAAACFFAMTANDEKVRVREAGFLYLAATHLATLTLFAHFSLLGVAAGSLAFPAQGSLLQQETITAALFITAVMGFGIKAGIIPLHVWLPTAHASAPTHISAMMSGLLIKTGIYGLFRFISFFHEVPTWWGVTLLAIGAISALTGVVFALAQHDLKRLLAYHSIENIGIIFMGLGTGVIGLSLGNRTLMVLGIGGALLHTINHALFKGLLFLAIGSVIHATGSRQIDRLGGLGRQMPLTSFFFLLGAVAISGLPPLNGFISELLIYLGLFSGLQGDGTTSLSAMALAIPMLAMVGGLAIACFIKVYGVVFLGHPRNDCHGDDPTAAMLVAMALLALPCFIIGILPQPVAALLAPAIANVVPVTADQVREAIAPLRQLLIPTAIFIALSITVFILFRLSSRRERCTESTWSCGYLTPTPRMQYTASSFAATLVDIFRSILRPHQRHPQLAPYFPDRQRHRSHQPETVLEYLIMPLVRVIEQLSSWLRRLQHGQLHLYILYIFLTVLILLAWSHG